MRLEIFEDGLDRYGGDLAKWPAELREEAETLVAGNAAAARLLAQSQRLDGLLMAATRPLTMDSAALGKILAVTGNGGHHPVVVRPTGRLIGWASAAMVVWLVAGFAAGLAVPQNSGEDAIAGLVFGSSDNATSSDVSGELL
jgi:hypothetical protein